jgi:hypothetical protein
MEADHAVDKPYHTTYQHTPSLPYHPFLPHTVTYAANGLLERPGGSPALLYHTLNGAVALAFVVLAAYSYDMVGGWVGRT